MLFFCLTVFNPLYVSEYKYMHSKAQLPPDDKAVPCKKRFTLFRETSQEREDEAKGKVCQSAPLTYLDAAR